MAAVRGAVPTRGKPKEGAYDVMNISIPEPETPSAVLVIEANGKRLYANIEDNPSAKAFTEKLNPGGIEVRMRDRGGYGKSGALPWELIRSGECGTAAPGDVILDGGDGITVCYGENERDLTRIARIGGTAREELAKILGEGDVRLKFYLEWSE